MGRIQAQALKNTVFSYIGLVLGYLNVVILFPAYFSVEEFGLIQLLAGMAIVYSQLSALGLTNAIVRFFPFFKTDDKKHGGFLFLVMLIAVAGFVIVTLIYVVLKPFISAQFIENSALYVDYYYFLVPISLFQLLFTVFEGVTRAVHQTVFAVFLRDVLFRVLTTAGIFLVFFKVIDFYQFLVFYVLINGLVVILLLGQVIFTREYKLIVGSKLLNKLRAKEVIRYGLFTLLGGSSYFLAQNIDKIMIGSMVGLRMVGIYSLFIYIATVIFFPARSLYRITMPTITEAWKENDVQLISALYKRTSLLLLIIGSIVYVGIAINKENILYFINPEYREGFVFYYFLGLSFLIDMTGGINSDIISTSVKYRYDTLFNIIYAGLCILLNFIFITLYGAIGAAIATMLSVLIFNLLKWGFLFKEYKMQPFDSKNVIVVVLAGITLLIGLFLPALGNVYLDIVYRSGICTAFYLGSLLLFKVSSDINEKFDKYARKLKLIR